MREHIQRASQQQGARPAAAAVLQLASLARQIGSQCDDDNNGGRRETRWCAVTGGRGFMARHLVAALLRSGEWRVRVTDLTPTLVLGPGETEEIFGDALRDGRAIYASADVCNLEQLIKGNKYIYYQMIAVEEFFYAKSVSHSSDLIASVTRSWAAVRFVGVSSVSFFLFYFALCLTCGTILSAPTIRFFGCRALYSGFGPDSSRPLLLSFPRYVSVVCQWSLERATRGDARLLGYSALGFVICLSILPLGFMDLRYLSFLLVF